MKYKKPPRLGIALIVSGPSGAGKSTVCQALRKIKGDLHFSVSCTTREPRPGEKDGIEYYFIGNDEFKRRIENDEFIEHADVHGHLYGTLRKEVIDFVKKGRDVLLDIDVQGAMQIRSKTENDEVLRSSTEFVFIGPPNFTELERRLRSRATETEDAIRTRLENARKELDCWDKYDYLLINKDIDKTVEDLKCLLDILHKSTKRLEDSGFYV